MEGQATPPGLEPPPSHLVGFVCGEPLVVLRHVVALAEQVESKLGGEGVAVATGVCVCAFQRKAFGGTARACDPVQGWGAASRPLLGGLSRAGGPAGGCGGARAPGPRTWCTSRLPTISSRPFLSLATASPATCGVAGQVVGIRGKTAQRLGLACPSAAGLQRGPAPCAPRPGPGCGASQRRASQTRAWQRTRAGGTRHCARGGGGRHAAGVRHYTRKKGERRPMHDAA